MPSKWNSKSIVAAWLLLSLLAAVSGFWLGQVTEIPGPTSLESILSNPGEQVAINSGLHPKDELIVILHHDRYLSTDQEFTIARKQLVDTLEATKQHQGNRSALLLVQSQDSTSSDESRFISNDGHSSLIRASSRKPIYKAKDDLLKVAAALEGWQLQHRDFKVYFTSNNLSNEEMFAVINSDLDSSLITTVPLTFIILLWTFRSFVAALVPVIVAGVSLLASLGCAALLSHLTGAISATASQLVVLLVLALGVDYSLFFISRVRELTASNGNYAVSIQEASRTTGRAIWWSGLVVALSLAGLYLMEDTVLVSMATVSLVSVI